MNSAQSYSPGLVQIEGIPPIKHLVPSRYNARSVATDGTLILLNTYTGTFSGFPAALRKKVEERIRKRGVNGPVEGLTKYLYERGYLIEKGTNEMQRLRHLFGQLQYRSDRLELILLASEECNFRCIYCYETFPRGTMEPWVRSAVVKLISQRIKTLRSVHVSWFGGEPLLGFEAIEDIAPQAVRLSEEHKVAYSAAMTTNGYLLTVERFRKLLQWKCNSYQITLDGAPEDHDTHRVLKEGGNTFNVIYDNLREIKQLTDPFSISIRVNFDKKTLAHIPAFFEKMRVFQGDNRFRLRFYPVGKWGGKNDEELDVCGTGSEEQRRRLTEEAAAEGLDAETRKPFMDARSGNTVCYAARPYNYIVGADGKLMKCTIALDTKDYNIVGRLAADGRPLLDVDKLTLWTAPYFEDDPSCKRCFYVPICQGTSCPLVILEDHKRPCPAEKLEIRKTLRTVWEVEKASGNRYNIETGTRTKATSTSEVVC